MVVDTVVKWLFVLLLMVTLGCTNDAQIASHNLSVAADQFQINRRIVFYNSILGEYLLSVEGRCSINKDNSDNQLEVTCKTSETTYKKHFLGLAESVTYFAEQLDDVPASVYHYKVIYKPLSILPDIDIKK